MSYLKKYEYVIAVSDCGGISQAAERLKISQPTFSKYLKKIETELGIELFDRSTLPIKLTKAGECYVNAGRHFIDMDRQLTKQLDEIKTNVNSVIRIGISPSRSPYMMPDIIALYKEKNPDGRVVIEERTTNELNKRLTLGELDLVISILDKETEIFDRIELFDENVLLAVPKGKCLNNSSSKKILMSSTVINVGKGQVMWQMLNEIIDDMGICQPEIECQSIESALALVKKGIGVMIVPSYIARENKNKQNSEVCFLPLTDISKNSKLSSYNRKICLFFRKEQFLAQSEKTFIECVKEINKTDN